MPTGDIPGWHQIFTDDFNYTIPLGAFPVSLQSTWGNSYADGWKDTTGNGTYMPSKVVSIANGVMSLYLHTSGGVHMVAAPVPTLPTMTYGRYVIRFRSDPVPGYKTAWLLWPDSEVWPRDGEIDFPEASLNGTIGGFVHYQGATSGSDQAAFGTNVTYTGWHTAVIDWLPTGVTLELDGQVVGQTTTRTPNTPMHWVLQTETDTGGPAPSATASGNVQIDWVAVYSRA
jgi:beta-glucanase (GH16 family)